MYSAYCPPAEMNRSCWLMLSRENQSDQSATRNFTWERPSLHSFWAQRCKQTKAVTIELASIWKTSWSELPAQNTKRVLCCYRNLLYLYNNELHGVSDAYNKDVCTLKGYSGINSIHVLTHLDTEYDPPSRDKVCRPLRYLVLASSEMAAQQQYTAANGSK